MDTQTETETHSETYGLSNIKSALSLLSNESPAIAVPPGLLQGETFISTLANAFCNSSSLLSVYRACGCLHEGHVRQVVQVLVFMGLTAVRPAIRLLTVMRGLPGNVELGLQLLGEIGPSSYAALDTLTLALIARQSGPKAPHFRELVSVLLSRIGDENAEEVRFALAHLFQTYYDPPKDPEFAIYNWTSETQAHAEPSIWKELKWAEFASRQCVSNGSLRYFKVPSISETNSAPFTELPNSVGPALPHYVSVCDVWFRRRTVSRACLAVSTGSSVSQLKDRDFCVIITPSIHEALRLIASVLSFGMPLVLEGPSGCGKTTILSLLARETVRNFADSISLMDAPGVTFVQLDSVMSNADADSFSSLVGGVVPLPEGGGFRWRPGPIGLALERGDWLVFENIGSSASSSSVAHILCRLAELSPGDHFEAPGRGAPIRVALGFRCIVTRTISESAEIDLWGPPGGWELWRRVRMQELSDEEVKNVLRRRFPQVSDCIQRVMSAVSLIRAYLSTKTGVFKVLPSLRDALRICCRLNFLRQDGGVMTTESAFMECYDVLVAWCPLEEYRGNMLDILSSCWSMPPGASTRLLSANVPPLFRGSDSFRVGRAIVRPSHCRKGLPVNTKLCLNGHTLRLFEQVLRCVQVGETVLLTGEAGSGKTAVVQELSLTLGKDLAIVNLSRQSELSDLMGNFRPVEVSVMVPQLAKRFEQLFCVYMSKERNARFLDALQRAARASSQHGRALRLMKGALTAVPRHVKHKSSDSLQRWSEISDEVDSLEKAVFVDSMADERLNVERPKKRPRKIHDERSVRQRRVEFKFCDGALIKAMRAGHWVLLDEINLAPPDLLERLISVIDRGEALLSDEKGELVRAHPEFTLFGAMNPPTDFGKKPLPAALKARLTELQVGDVGNRRDVVDLILHCFFHRDVFPHAHERRVREEDVLAENSATFFLDCLKLAKDGRIEDTTGKPVRYSIRTLTRMLDFANGIRSLMKPTSDSLRRSLYEGALVAFGSSLPRRCKGIVSGHAKKLFLGVSGRLSQLISMYGANSLSSASTLEGFPLVLKSSACEGQSTSSSFIVSPIVRQTLREVCRCMLIGAPTYPILLQGPTAAGKTSIVIHLSECTGNQLIRINNHEHTELSEYLGGYVATADGSLRFCEGPLVRAARLGEWVLLDELNLAPPDVLEALNRLLDDNREIFVPETGEVVKAAPGFRLFATQNPPGLYGGRKELSRAFRSRFVELQVDELPDEDLLMILEGSSVLPRSFARGMLSVMRELQIRRQTSTIFTGREGFVTARDLFRWSARRPRSKEELAMHGFFLLGERARHNIERETVRNVLVKSLGVSTDVLSDNHLYDLGEYIGAPSHSQECLEVSMKKLGLSISNLLNTLSKMGIATTPHTRRMLVLILHSMANREPSLLVGPTGTGKTSCCSAICSAINLELLSINCHKHTESSDMLGGFRPVRTPLPGGPLFEWHNGPLIDSMVKGSALLIDEINMADDAVIERLNSVLEPNGTLLLSEKGSSVSESRDVLAPELLKAKESFVVLATMNPGGDFGKKELSPALRNRFTEVWIPQPHSLEDYVPIVDKFLSPISFGNNDNHVMSVVQVLTRFLSHLLHDGELTDDGNIAFLVSEKHFLLTLRDLKSWCIFTSEAVASLKLPAVLALAHGARLVFLDGLSVGAAEGWQINVGNHLWNTLLALLPKPLQSNAGTFDFSTSDSIEFIRNTTNSEPWCVEVGGFRVTRNGQPHPKICRDEGPFSFDAPNTLRNTARLARAMCVGHHPLLLEGPPGGGKTSLISALATEAGFSFVRVNLSEATEISDLIGSNAPGSMPGVFTFREGPLLKSLRQGSWLLLDELNLASQSVLEGLNSVLDHRRELYVPEIKETVHAHFSFRVFGAQNPASDGGGRRGLPKSFLNRFVKVWVEPPDVNDVRTILFASHPMIAQDVICKIIALLDKIKGSLRSKVPGVFGLRDALRWCDLLQKYIQANTLSFPQDNSVERCGNMNMLKLLGTSFDVIVLQGIPGDYERSMAEDAFKSVFGHSWRINREEPVIRDSSEGLRVGLTEMGNTSQVSFYNLSETLDVHIGSSNLRELQALSLATKFLWPVVLFSESSSRSRHVSCQLFNFVAASRGKRTYVISGGSLTDVNGFIGGYVQRDITRTLHDCLGGWRELLRKLFCSAAITRDHSIVLLRKINNFVCVELPCPESTSEDKLLSFVETFISSSHDLLGLLDETQSISMHLDQEFASVTRSLSQLLQLKSSMDAGEFASFEWRKSDLMEAVERGDWILVHDADQCPPSVLDRINPLFERRPAATTESSIESITEGMIIAEAPSGEDGSSMCVRPHPEFRMFFTVSSRGDKHVIPGLSRALLDRSLRVYISEAPSLNAIPLVEDEISFQCHHRFHLASRSACVPAVTGGPGGRWTDNPDVPEQGVFCTSNSNNRLNQTRLFELVLNTKTAVVERDLFALRTLEETVGDVVSNLFTTLESCENYNSDSQSIFSQKVRNGFRGHASEKLLYSGGSIFLLNSSSQDDFSFRLKALRHLAEETSNLTHRKTYKSVISVGSAANVWSVHGARPCDDASTTMVGVPIDPIYAFDRSALLFMCQLKDANIDRVMLVSRAKRFRFEVLGAQRLRMLWEHGNDPSRVQSNRWSRAKAEHALEGKGISSFESFIGMNSLAFNQVKQIAESCSSICNAICQNSSLNADSDMELLDVLEATIKLGENLLDDNSDATENLSLFFTTASSLCSLRDSQLLPTGVDNYSRLLTGFVKQLDSCLADVPVLLMPTTMSGRDIELKLFEGLSKYRRRHLSISESHAVTKAIVTVRDERAESNGQLCETLTKLVTKIFNDSSQYPTAHVYCPMRHWGLIARNELLVLYRDMAVSLTLPANRNTLLKQVSSVLERINSSDSVEFLTAASVQRSLWLLDENRRGNGYHKPALCDLLKELSGTVYQVDDCAVTGLCPTALNSILELARPRSSIPFWDLHSASLESVSAALLVVCGMHVIKVLDDKFTLLLSVSLVSALSDLGTTQGAEVNLEFLQKWQKKGEYFSSVEDLHRFMLSCKSEEPCVRYLRYAVNIVAHRASGNFKNLSSKSISSPTAFFGIVWLCIGLIRLTGHLHFIRSFEGVDPSDVSNALMTSTFRDSLEALVGQKAYMTVGKNRLGGEDPASCDPNLLLQKRLQQSTLLFHKAKSRYVQRPPGKSSFKAYESTVLSAVEGVTRVLENGLFEKVERLFSGGNHGCIESEIESLMISCRKAAESLQCNGPLAHFRDCSPSFELGLRECEYGLVHIQKSFNDHSRLSKVNVSSRMAILSELSHFPRHCFPGPHLAVPAVQRCIELSLDGDALIALAEYFVFINRRDGFLDVNDVSGALASIHNAWKAQLNVEEEEHERKSSLHLFREDVCRNDTPGGNVIASLEVDEENDFLATFHSMNEELERSLFEEVESREIVDLSTVASDNTAAVKPIKVNPEAFFDLHAKIFTTDGALLAPPETSSYVDIMNNVCSHLSLISDGVAENSDIASTVWVSLCTLSIARQFLFESPKDSYNFYSDPNIVELAEASSALWSLYVMVQKVQSKFFKDTGGHPVLSEIESIIDRISKACKSGEALSNIVVGIEHVLRKIDEWHRLFSTKETRLDRDQTTLSLLVLKLRKLEMSCWPTLLRNRLSTFKRKATKWFFLLYDIVIGQGVYSQSISEESISEVVSSLDQFLRSSPVGEFARRIEMVISVSSHLLAVSAEGDQRARLGYILYGLSLSYSTFESRVNAQIKLMEEEVYGKLSEFTKLVSWTATEDLGSSQVMPKQKTKHLEYYRLKASAEKTRRRLHKLCLEMDVIYRQPVYGYITKELAKIGLQAVLVDGTLDERELPKRQTKETFSDTINLACERLTFLESFYPVDTRAALQVEEPYCGFLSRYDHLTKKVGQYGKLICADCNNAEQAVRFILSLRNMIRQRVYDLRSLTGPSIQLKKRSFVNLLRALRAMGLSPFYTAKESVINPLFCFSTPSPSGCSEYDYIANNLYVTCFHHLRRLYDTSDSRTRATDITRDETSRAIAFCTQIFEQVCAQRTHLHEFVTAMGKVSEKAATLAKFDFQPCENFGSYLWQSGHCREFREFTKKIKSSLEDIHVIEYILKTTESLSHANSRTMTKDFLEGSSAPAVLRQIQDSAYNGKVVLLAEKALASSKVIRAFLEDESVTTIDASSPRFLSYLDGRLDASLSKTGPLIKKLKSQLNAILDEVEDMSSSNVLTQALKPIAKLLESYDISPQDTPNVMNGNTDDVAINLVQSKSVANDILRYVLICVQRVVHWSGTDVNLENSRLDESKPREDNLEFPNILKLMNQKLETLRSDSGLDELLRLMETNENFLDVISSMRSFYSIDDRSTIVHIQRQVGCFVAKFLTEVITPALQKVAEYHCHLMSLLRTLTSLFIGLFAEGYCRPAEESAGDEENVEDISGSGFGEANGGDLSHAQNVSKEVEDEEQLIGLMNEQCQTNKEGNITDEINEDAVNMTTDFDGELTDDPHGKNDIDENNEAKEADRQLSEEHAKGKDEVDERMWQDGDNFASDGDSETGEDGKLRNEAPAELVAGEENLDANCAESKSKRDKTQDLAQREEDPPVDTKDVEGFDCDVEDGDNDQDENEDKGGTDREHRNGKPLDDSEVGRDNNHDDPDMADDEEGNETTGRGSDLDGAEGDIAEMEEEKDKGCSHNENGDETGSGYENQEKSSHVSGQDDLNAEEAEKDQDGGDDGCDAMIGEPTDNADGGESDEYLKNEDHAKADDANDFDMDIGDLPEDDNIDGDDVHDDKISSSTADAEDMENETALDVDTAKLSEDHTEGVEGPVPPTSMEAVPGVATTTQSNHPQCNTNSMNVFSSGIDSGVTPESMKPGGDVAKRHGNGVGGPENDDKGNNQEGPQGQNQILKSHSPEDPTGKSRLFHDANPLRVAADAELVQHWEKYLDAVENEHNNDFDVDPADEGGTNWEFTHEKNDNSSERVALAEATNDQQVPLPTRSDEEDRHSTHSHEDDDNVKDTVESTPRSLGDLSQRSNVGMNDERNVLKERGADSAVEVAVPETRMHPARKAVERKDCNDPLNFDHTTADAHDDTAETDNLPEKASIVLDDSLKPKWDVDSLSEEEACSLWKDLEAKVSHEASLLCEQLRLVLEPTTKSSLAGGYRTGKRLNMRKVIEYVASDFRKDRIWLRRTKADKRSYDVMIAIDDSASMMEGEGGAMALESVALLLSAMGKLEVGRVAVVGFGSDTSLVRDFDETLPISHLQGGRLLQHFSFSQTETNMVNLLDFAWKKVVNDGHCGGSEKDRLSLLFVISDGRLSNREEIKRYIRRMKDENVLVAAVIVDKTISGNDTKAGNTTTSSIFEVKRVEYEGSGNVSVVPYMHDFPIPFYVVVQDPRIMPSVLSNALKHWIEVTSK